MNNKLFEKMYFFYSQVDQRKKKTKSKPGVYWYISEKIFKYFPLISEETQF